MKCGFCHTDVTWTGASLYHENSIFQLTGIHRQAACADCHPDRDFSRKLTSCYGCHQEMDEHNGKFGQTCSTCHSPTSWSMASFNHIFGVKAHGGIYRNDECRRCHGDVFKGTPDECEACHSDPAIHAGMFEEACSTCHTPAGWIPAKYFAEHTFPTDHGRDFASTCETCHPFSLNDYTCYGCHEHNQAVIEARYRERGVEDFADCMRCHPLGEIDPEMKLPGEIDAETDTSPN